MLPQHTDYIHDVFFSYKRHNLTLEWTRNVHTRLKFWIQQAVGGREVKMFVDEDNIEAGDHWPDRLRDALRLSRCMVCLWSPEYFQSSWCVSEWRSFLERERRIGMQSHGLIAPMRFHDGEHFPAEAQVVQWIDVAPYSYTVSAFWTSPKAMDLEDELKKLADNVAQMITQAPPFEPDWPILVAPGVVPGKIGLAKL